MARSYSGLALHNRKKSSEAKTQAPRLTQGRIRRSSPRLRKPDGSLIFVGDMQATIDAHRAANLSKKIRKIVAINVTEPGYKRIVLPAAQRTDAPKLPAQKPSPSTDRAREENVGLFTDTASLPQSLPNDQPDPPGTPNPSSDNSPNKSSDYKGQSIPIKGTWSSTRHRRPFRHLQLRGIEAGSKDQEVLRTEKAEPTEASRIRQPWMNHIQAEEVDARLRLEEEISAFERYMRLTREEERSTQDTIDFARSIVATVAPSNELSLHGSRSTGLAIPTSDIDFSVSLPEYEKDPQKRGPSASRPEAKRAGRKLLFTIMKALQKCRRYRKVQFVHARVDLVTAVDFSAGLELQFSTLAPFLPAREYSMYYLSEFPTLRPLYILLRHFLLMRNLTGVQHGGVGSYALLIMIVAALKHWPPLLNSGDLAEQLLHVLKFWSQADLYQYGYCADPPSRFGKKPAKVSKQQRDERASDPSLNSIDFILRQQSEDTPFALCLQDPANPTNDLGRNVTQIKHIQASLLVARTELQRSISDFERRMDEHNAVGYFSFLDGMLGADYYDFERRREQLANAPISIPQNQKEIAAIRPSTASSIASMSRRTFGNIYHDVSRPRIRKLNVDLAESNGAGAEAEDAEFLKSGYGLPRNLGNARKRRDGWGQSFRSAVAPDSGSVKEL
ncbi:hypothetical protein MMC13_000185 [Lambiella insularis]|nr:hypothetical protein [Lambiella insularis]